MNKRIALSLLVLVILVANMVAGEGGQLDSIARKNQSLVAASPAADGNAAQIESDAPAPRMAAAAAASPATDWLEPYQPSTSARRTARTERNRASYSGSPGELPREKLNLEG